ncbi:MAG: hypothetical protein J0H42_09695 [Rhizobiales bacterium]|nr:hypothetical protein [Hyphomicrobiales bacterium]
MNRTSLFAFALALAAFAGIGCGHAQEGIDKAKAHDFDARLFARPHDQKTYACFVRRYGSSHLAQHPQQKVSAMKLLVTAEIPPEEPTTINYSFHLGVTYRQKSGHFDSGGSCHHVVAEEKGGEIHLGCGVDCDGGGIAVAMSTDDKSAIVELERVRVWDRKKPDEDNMHDLEAGADDKMFRVDRADLNECAELVTDRKELAALRKQRLAELRRE